MPRVYRTGIYYSINIGDGLIHVAWVKNTIHGPWFLALCSDANQSQVRGAELPCDAQPTCLECLSKRE